MTSPIHSNHSFAILSKGSIISLVSCLLLPSNPSAILGRVSEAIINSFKCVFCSWRKPHIFKEIRKTIEPSVADGYSSTTVATKGFVAFIYAAIFHLPPSAVNLRICKSMIVMHLLDKQRVAVTE